jgi:hypothetical protein
MYVGLSTVRDHTFRPNFFVLQEIRLETMHSLTLYCAIYCSNLEFTNLHAITR